jgi:hypothetical protein
MHCSSLLQIENDLTRGHAIWIVEMIYDSLKGIVKIGFTQNPETRKIDRWLSFRDVLDFKDRRSEENDSIPNLIGILVDGKLGGTRYTITSDMNEISLFTTAKPEISFR